MRPQSPGGGVLLPAAQQTLSKVAFADALTMVFVYAIPVMLAAFLVSLLLKEIPYAGASTLARTPRANSRQRVRLVRRSPMRLKSPEGILRQQRVLDGIRNKLVPTRARVPSARLGQPRMTWTVRIDATSMPR